MNGSPIITLIDRAPYFAAAWAIACATFFAPQAWAQVSVDPLTRVGDVPTFAGTGLKGFYYNDPAAVDNEQEQGNFDNAIIDAIGPETGYPILATFLAPNICFTDCFRFLDDDSTGGLTTFLNGNATNIQFVDMQSPPPPTWNNSGLIFNGYIAINQIGTYNFDLESDDGSVLSIGNYHGGSNQLSFSATGLYQIAINFFEVGGGSGLTLNANDANGDCVLGCAIDESGTPGPNSLFYSDAQLQGAPAPIVGGGWTGTAILALLGAAALVRRRVTA